MRFCFVAYDRPNYRSGPIVNLRRLLPALRAYGHEALLLNFYQHEPTTAHWFTEQGIECRVRRRSPGYTDSHVRWILEQLRDQRPDVFVPNVSVPAYFAARWARGSGIATIGTMRSNDAFYWGVVDEFVSGPPEWALSGLVCVSEHLRGLVARRQPRQTALFTIPSGVPLPAIVSQQQGPLRFVYIGRLVRLHKRIHEVVEALTAALLAIPDATATIIGEGVEEPWIAARFRESGLKHRTTIAGTVPPESLHAELHKHHALVLLSDTEGTPGAVMDAMACGLVPVCRDIPGGVRELVRPEETGLLVADHGAAFVEAARRLALDGALRRRLAGNARRLIEQSYSLELTAQRWIQCAHQLRSSRKGVTDGVVSIPARFRLRPVHASFARQDIRKLGLARRLRRIAGRLVRSAFRR
jgi:colanic acid/amylovoran biosynthesis glycosyltransferase